MNEERSLFGELEFTVPLNFQSTAPYLSTSLPLSILRLGGCKAKGDTSPNLHRNDSVREKCRVTSSKNSQARNAARDANATPSVITLNNVRIFARRQKFHAVEGSAGTRARK